MKLLKYPIQKLKLKKLKKFAGKSKNRRFYSSIKLHEWPFGVSSETYMTQAAKRKIGHLKFPHPLFKHFFENFIRYIKWYIYIYYYIYTIYKYIYIYIYIYIYMYIYIYKQDFFIFQFTVFYENFLSSRMVVVGRKFP